MLHHENCESRFGQPLDAIITDPPYNTSTTEYTGGEKAISGFTDGHRPVRRDFGEWDKDYDPSFLVGQAEENLVEGGWLVAFAGDEMFSAYNKLIRDSEILKYKTTIAWIITNPMPSVRQVNFTSSVQWIVVAHKVGKPIAWNWLGQREMYNWVMGPNCGGKERLYWHLTEGQVHPCLNNCSWCRERGKDDKRNHPTQKPIWLWKWLYKRLTVPGMKVYDPYAGLGSSGVAAVDYKLDWFGSELKPEFATVGQMWLSGKWRPHAEQERMF